CEKCRSIEDKVAGMEVAVRSKNDQWREHCKEWPELHDFAHQLFGRFGFDLESFYLLESHLKRVLDRTSVGGVTLREVADRLKRELEQKRTAGATEKTETKWSNPEGIKHWATVFGKSDSTIRRWFAKQQIHNKDVSSKSYAVDIKDLPHAY